MQNYKLHNDLKILSGYVYGNKNIKKPNSWISLKTIENHRNGFYAEIFVSNNNVAIVFRGTNDKNDFLKNDIPMGMTFLPSQITDARNFYKQVKNNFPNQDIILTGHSLGGSLAQAIGAETGENAVTFNAYGLKKIYSQTFQNPKNITNYGNVDDPIFISNMDNQLGKTLLIDNYKDNQGAIYKNFEINNDYFKEKHYLENMDELSTAILYCGQNLQTEGQTSMNKRKKNLTMNFMQKSL